MKVLMLTHDFPPKIGGIASHVYHLAKNLADLNVEIDLIVPYEKKRWDYPLTDIHENINVYVISQSNIRKYREIEYVIKAIYLFEKKLKNNNYDLIHYHNLLPESIIAKYIKKRLKKPSIFTNHESYFLDKFDEGKKELLFKLIRHNDFIICPSEELKEKTILTGFPKEKVNFIPNGVDTEFFNPDLYSSEDIENLKKSFNLLEKDVILCPRRLEYKNGVHYAVRAMRYVIDDFPDSLLVIAGGGTEEEFNFIKNEIKKNNVENNVILLGNIPNYKMRELYVISDIVVLPSLKEAVSIAGLEAMSMKRPLIGTKVGGIPYLIDDGVTGYLVNPKDYKNLAERIKILLNNTELRKNFGENARKKVINEFDWKVISKKTLEVYENVL